MEEILGVKGDGCGWDWNVFIQCTTVADISPHGERHRFGLWDGITGSNFSSFRFKAGRILRQIVPAASRDSWGTLALSSWMVACCSFSCRLCPGPWLWLGLWLWTWACTSRSSSRETSESDGLLVYESAEPYKHIITPHTSLLDINSQIDTNMENLTAEGLTLLCYDFCSTFKGKQDNSGGKKSIIVMTLVYSMHYADGWLNIQIRRIFQRWEMEDSSNLKSVSASFGSFRSNNKPWNHYTLSLF